MQKVGNVKEMSSQGKNDLKGHYVINQLLLYHWKSTKLHVLETKSKLFNCHVCDFDYVWYDLTGWHTKQRFSLHYQRTQQWGSHPELGSAGLDEQVYNDLHCRQWAIQLNPTNWRNVFNKWGISSSGRRWINRACSSVQTAQWLEHFTLVGLTFKM